MNPNLELAAAIKRQYGVDPIQMPIYASKFVPNAGFGVAGADLLSVRLGQLDPDDPRAAAAQVKLTYEETNVEWDGVLPFRFIATGVQSELHLLPKARQVSGFSGDADGIWGVAWGVMDEIYNLMNRGVLSLELNDAPKFKQVQPFRNCPPANNIVVQNLGAANLASQVNQYWVTQPASAKLADFPEPLEFPKGTRLKAPLTFPDGATTTLDDAWTGSLDPYLRIRLRIMGYQLPN